MDGKKASSQEIIEDNISRYEETKLDDSKTEENLGPFGNFLKSLVTQNTYL